MSRSKAIVTVVVALTLVTLMLAEPPGQPVKDPLGRPSTFFTDDTGARAILLVLRKVLGPDAAQQHRAPLDSLGGDGPDTLIVAGPSRPLEPTDEEALDQWLDGGGQLILATQDGWPLSETEDSYLESYGVSQKAVTLSQFSQTLQPDGPSLWLRHAATWEGECEVLFRSQEQVVAIEIPVGEGRIVALADPWILSNDSLKLGDNGLWIVRLVEEWGDGRALFDEFHHGFGERATLFAVMGRFLASPWGWPVGQLALAGLLY
ncbi:MAG: DUF4350 domain-containing protein, partial [Candidatus Eremiobacterota bacterium]